MAAPSSQLDQQAAIYVSIVSANRETLDGLQSYLGNAGVPSHCVRTLKNMERIAPQCATAAVLFPDDFEVDAAVALVRELRRTRPKLLALIVTREPHRFRDVVRGDGRSLRPILLPRPSFGWEILDAIRAYADTEQI